jgi:threonine dehydratase
MEFVSLCVLQVVVKEEWIAIAILRLVELEKCVVEGAGAAGLAAILAGHLSELKGKRSVSGLWVGAHVIHTLTVNPDISISMVTPRFPLCCLSNGYW